MNVKLHRVDYHQVGVISRNSMKLLPPSGKTQKIVIGDHDGIVHCFHVKKGEIVNDFKTQPCSEKVSCVCLGGPKGGVQNRIFVSLGSEVKGFTKKGKQFLSFNTKVAEDIQSLCVVGVHLYVNSSHVLNHYLDCADTSYYLCSDVINDVIAYVEDDVGETCCILACQDHLLRVLQESNPMSSLELPGPPTVVKQYETGENHRLITYGTSDGLIGQVYLEGTTLLHKWNIPNKEGKGGVTCLDHYDLLNDGALDLIVGRDDGLVEVYVFNELELQPSLRFSYTFSESITSVQGGIVGTPGFREIIIATYTGWVVGLTSEDIHGSNDNTNDEITRNKSLALKQEVEQLSMKVGQAKELYQDLSQNPGKMLSVPDFQVNDKFVLNSEDATYILSVELQVPIDLIIVQSDVPIDLLDVERNSAVLSISPCSAEDGNLVLASYRCQVNVTKLDMKVRTIEGKNGVIQAYVIANVHPKTATLRRYPIKSLSLHKRSHSFDDSRPNNTLTLEGRFSLAEIHAWICQCLPELPERVPMEVPAIVNFVSTFLGTQLQCVYQKGKAVFKSDNLSTIAILKDILTKEATTKKIQLNITYDIKEESINHTLQYIHPHLEYQILLAKKVELIDGLKELQSEEPDLSFMSPNYRSILENADSLRAEFKKQPCYLQRLCGMITDLYIDRFRFRGENVKHKVPLLQDLLQNYDFHSLVEFFNSAQ